jgi:SNF family Na+-dependent transporter
MDKGWREITSGADIKVPNIYKFIIKYITPVLLIIIFLGSLFKPLGIMVEMFLVFLVETDGH